ncbi:MAG: hypothetical protein IPN96_13565 [Anaerolineales bacterium]|nr:hypothetical protein [Anaerolineales bacterium]
MNERATQNAKVEKIKNGWRLEIQKGDSLHYRDAQLDDYSQLPRHKFPHQTVSLSLRAKTSSTSIAGTWGFGLWNDPFGLSLGFGGSPFRLPALPNAVWFFYGSGENYLSFKVLRLRRQLRKTAAPLRMYQPMGLWRRHFVRQNFIRC